MSYISSCIAKCPIGILSLLGFFISFIAATSISLSVTADDIAQSASVSFPTWDVNHDGIVDISDVLLVTQHFGEDVIGATDIDHDVNSDGDVNILDLITISRNLGTKYFSVYVEDPLTEHGVPNCVLEVIHKETGELIYSGITDDSGMALVSTAADLTGTILVSVRDETIGDSIGQYHDVDGAIRDVNPGDTVSIQLVPNVELTDTVLQQTYGTFLELLRRKTGNEPLAVTHPEDAVGPIDTILQRWELSVFDFGNYHYEGRDYSARFVEIGDEINQRAGMIIVNQGVNANIIVDYSGREPSSVEVTSFDDGVLLSGVLHKKKYYLTEVELDTDIRKAFLKALLLNNDVDDLLTEKGQFKDEAIKLLQYVYSMDNGTDLSAYDSEANRPPVAMVTVGGDPYHVGEPIRLDGSGSQDLDGRIVRTEWRQVHARPDQLDYITEWDGRIDPSNGETTILFADQMGNYRISCTVTDDGGMSNTTYTDVLVKPLSPPNLPYRVINMLDVPSADYLGLEGETIRRIAAMGATHIELVDTIWYTQVEPLPVISRFLMSEGQLIEHSDEIYTRVFEEARKNGIGVVLSEQLFIGPGVDFPCPFNCIHPQEWWDAWFEQMEPILLRQAALAEEYGVEIFDPYYFNYANLHDPRNNSFERLVGLLAKIRGVFSGKIAVRSGLDGTPDNPFNGALYQPILASDMVDLVFQDYGVWFFSPSDPEPGIEELVEMMKASFVNKGNRREGLLDTALRINKPMIFNLIWYSANRQNDYEGYEPSAPTPPGVEVDFPEQVKFYEAMTRAIRESPIAPYIVGMGPRRNWWCDTFDYYLAVEGGLLGPAAGRTHTTIRNKPTEEFFRMISDSLR
ncbi:dockerin type I domain-containing protein [Candidatus Poribacteria bacterium]